MSGTAVATFMQYISAIHVHGLITINCCRDLWLSVWKSAIHVQGLITIKCCRHLWQCLKVTCQLDDVQQFCRRRDDVTMYSPSIYIDSSLKTLTRRAHEYPPIVNTLLSMKYTFHKYTVQQCLIIHDMCQFEWYTVLIIHQP